MQQLLGRMLRFESKPLAGCGPRAPNVLSNCWAASSNCVCICRGLPWMRKYLSATTLKTRA
eukprot:4242778-Alexandrium_andersonii.AAC.1